jgi:hypothetical protein
MTPQELKKSKERERRRKALLLGLLFFRLPRWLVKQQAMSADTMTGQFDDLDDLISEGAHVKKAARGMKKLIARTMKNLIFSSMMNGYLDAVKHSGASAPKLQGHKVRDLADARADKVGQFMEDTTKKVLKQNPDNAWILSPARAERAARYESRKAYYQGVMMGFKGQGLWMKEWVLHPNHDLDDTCDDNADMGPIPMEEEFDTGDDAPPAHLNCICEMTVRMK